MGFLKYLIMLIPSLIYKGILKHKKQSIWLIQEDAYHACDNGYYLFKHIRKYHPSKRAYYVIKKDSNEYEKVEKYGNVIEYGSLKHYLYYMVGINITTKEDSSPCPYLFNLLRKFNLYNNRVFLQRGITKDNIVNLHYKNTKFRLFVCGAKKEYDYIKENYGYPSQNIKYLGLPRFDEWENKVVDKSKILIMPTYRNLYGENLEETKYYKRWNSLINNKQLIKYIEKNNIVINFYLHNRMHKYIDHFHTKSKNINIVKSGDITKLLKESALLVTDYSSVYMDFAYMEKPVIYYQFDYKEYRKTIYKEGYYNYSKDAFGKIILDEDDLVKKIIAYATLNYKLEDVYVKKMNKFFTKKDSLNSERVYMAIEELGD